MSAINHREWDYYGKRQGWNTPPQRLSDTELLREVGRRGLQVEPELVRVINPLEDHVAEFIDTDRSMPVAEQLSVMGRLLAEFGQDMPALSSKQIAQLKERSAQRPDLRVVPTKLDAVAQRRQNASVLPGSPLAKLLPKESLWLPDQGSAADAALWGRLWTESGGPVRDQGRIFQKVKKTEPQSAALYFTLSREEPVTYENKDYDLRYKTSRGRLMPRADYLEDLAASGQAVVTPDGEIWIYPLMVVSQRPSRRGETDSVRSLHGRTDTTLGPEPLINLQLLHVVAGKPLHQDIVDVANEAICELDERGEAVRMVAATCITNARKKDGSVDFVRQLWHRAGNAGGDYQRVEGISGIGR